MSETFTPPGDDWIEGPLFPPDLQKGPIETVRYSVARIGAEDREQVWHRQRVIRGERMTVDELRARIDERIRLGNDDPEASHGDIDGICEDVLRAIAIGSPDAAELAALTVGLLDYETDHEWTRWYA